MHFMHFSLTYINIFTLLLKVQTFMEKFVYNDNKDMLAIKEICKFGKLNTFCMQEND